MYSTKKSKSAFTLIELLVVIAIIGLLASLMMPSITRARDKAQSTRCASNLRQLGAAVFLYATDHRGKFPSYRGQVSWDDEISGYDGRSALTDAQKNERYLKYDDFGPQPLYLCSAYENPSSVNHGGTRVIPRAYAINYYRPTNGYGGLNWAVGVSGIHSRMVGEAKDPSRAILLFEHYRAQGRLGDAGSQSLNGPTYRNFYSGPFPGYTDKGPHADGSAANFLMVDGHVEALDFVEVSTRLDTGQPIYAGGDWRTTMWDAGSGEKLTKPLP